MRTLLVVGVHEWLSRSWFDRGNISGGGKSGQLGSFVKKSFVFVPGLSEICFPVKQRRRNSDFIMILYSFCSV